MFGLVIAVFAVYLLILWLPNLTTLIITQEAIIEIGPGGFRRIAIPDIISMSLEDEKEVKALMVSQIVSCATIRSSDRAISFMYGNYDNADEVKIALQKIAHDRKL